MQSRLFTAILAFVTVLCGALAVVQLAQDDLSAVFGAPPRLVDEVLYQFERDRVHTVRISNSAGEAVIFRKHGGAWIMQDPVTGEAADRADYRDLQRIVYFSRFLRVEDVLRRQETTLEDTGLRETADHPGRFRITLTDNAGREVADYRLGRRTAWHRLDEDAGTVSETFFVRPNEKPQKDYIYVCSAPDEIQPSVRQILDRGFERLRDHRPFLFDPANLAEIKIRRGGRETVLSRSAPDQPWRMTKPLASRTKPETVAGLLKGLYGLEAVQVHDRKGVTIPPREEPFLEIELLRFDAEGERQHGSSRMIVEPPSAEGRDTVLATIDDRPGVVFELPLQPTEGRIALAQLPVAVDQLRARTLVSLDIRALRGLTIHHLTESDPIDIFLGREAHSGERRWMLNLNGDVAPANEVALAELLHAVSEDEVLGFASDAANDLGAYGLNPPHKRLVLRGAAEESIDLLFGRGVDGKFYATRRGSSSVAEIAAGTFTAIAARPHNWRDTLLMPFSVVDLTVMKIEPEVHPPFEDPSLLLHYDFIDESWEARRSGEDVTPRLNIQRADEYLDFMESLRVEKWLGDTFPLAERALQRPTFRFTAIFREVNDEGDRAGLREASFELAPGSSSSRNRFYYGRLLGDPHYFVLSADDYRRLTAPLLD